MDGKVYVDGSFLIVVQALQLVFLHGIQCQKGV